MKRLPELFQWPLLVSPEPQRVPHDHHRRSTAPLDLQREGYKLGSLPYFELNQIAFIAAP